MKRVYADFNARSEDGACLVLYYDEKPIEDSVGNNGLSDGDRIVLYQDEGDFEVHATLEKRSRPELNRSSWVAIPDWSTLVRFAD